MLPDFEDLKTKQSGGDQGLCHNRACRRHACGNCMRYTPCISYQLFVKSLFDFVERQCGRGPLMRCRYAIQHISRIIKELGWGAPASLGRSKD